jgi:hypothetical protein
MSWPIWALLALVIYFGVGRLIAGPFPQRGVGRGFWLVDLVIWPVLALVVLLGGGANDNDYDDF